MILYFLTVLYIIIISCLGSYCFLSLILPIIWKSRHVKTLKQRLSSSVLHLFLDIAATTYMYLETICEPEGDEEFIPYMDSPLRTCPPCETLYDHPKEESQGCVCDINGNYREVTNRNPRNRRPRIPAVLLNQRRGLNVHDIGFLLGADQELIQNARRVPVRRGIVREDAREAPNVNQNGQILIDHEFNGSPRDP